MEFASGLEEDQYSCSSSSIMSGHLAERQSSIDREPRTLSINQLEFAREVAEYVVNTRSTEDALQIFTQGLVPVARVCRDEKRPCASLVLTGEMEAEESWNTMVARDVASAPF